MKKYLAEFLGTMILVTFGCGSATALGVYTSASQRPLAYTALAVAFAFGLCLTALVYAIGHISGCHVNPAVTFGVFLTGKMSIKDFLGYIIAQFLGSVFGAGILFYIFLNLKGKVTYGSNDFITVSNIEIDALQAIVIEIILTFVFVLCVLSVTSKEKYSAVAGVVVGLALTLVHIFGLPFTGTSVNPARSFGPALFAGLFGGEAGLSALKHLPVFIGAPIIGGALAALVFNAFNKVKANNNEKSEEAVENVAE